MFGLPASLPPSLPIHFDISSGGEKADRITNEILLIFLVFECLPL